MMTVIYRGRRDRRYVARVAPSPSWGPLAIQDHGRRMAGSAKPGRGGRRKRKAERAKIRPRIGQDVERKGWPLAWALRRFLAWPTLRVRPLLLAEIAALASTPIVLPPGLEIQFLEPRRHPGRRERRRRAKLRRRRERARREGRPTPIAAPMPWEAATLEHATGEYLDQLAEMFGLIRTHGD